LIEGNTLRSVTRLTGVHRTTSQKLLVDFGTKCKAFMDRELRGLTLNHVEIDEIWSFVGKKQARLTVDEKRERHDVGDIFVWYGIDQDTKLVPSFILGKRSADNARRLMMDLRGRLAFSPPTPGQTDARNYQPTVYPTITQISTDGFAAYPEAVDLAFGPYAKFGVLIKEYKNARMAYDPSEMVGTKRRGIFGIDPDQVYSICTSHIERANLTMRTLMKRFTRLSLGFSKKLENMEAACSLFFAYYNWVWRTRHDDHSGRPGKLRPTAAMMAGVTDTLWTFEDLFDAVNG
jgi:IS1 family transposase